MITETLKYKTNDEEAEFVYDKLDQNILEYVYLKSNIVAKIKAHHLVEFLIRTDFLERRGYRPLEIERGTEHVAEE